MSTHNAWPRQTHDIDVAVVGGGMAGLFAAVYAARHGATVVLMHERPVLGGNASSECRVHISGADRHNGIPNMRETGLLEDLRMANLQRNPQRSFSVWDVLLHETAQMQDNLTLLLNCSCHDAAMDGERIEHIVGWQMTTHTVHEVRARTFIDCSGDGVLAPLTGAAFRMGREGRDEYDESAAPEVADTKTMGMTCLFAARETNEPQPYIPPAWAYRFESCEDLPYGTKQHTKFFEMGYWWTELGGEQHSIHDTETIRDELLRIVHGIWDHIKNHCPETREPAANWVLDWLQFLPAKRESRRYVGLHVLNQNDIEAGGMFDDTVAYGGWAMDDHRPAGFWGKDQDSPATNFYPTPSPYGIPLRSLLARDLPNLLFAGRCHSATHMGLSSTRVMGTCAVMGQAAGTAAAMAAQKDIQPAGMLEHIDELQQTILRDDGYLPNVAQRFSERTRQARIETSTGDLAEVVRDGWARPIGEDSHAWTWRPGDWIVYTFDSPGQVETVTAIVDSALHLDPQMSRLKGFRKHDIRQLPNVLPKGLRLDVLRNGTWQEAWRCDENIRRHIRIPLGQEVEGVRLRLEETWGPCDGSNLYALYVE